MRDPRIEHWDDERGLGNSLVVTLKVGWRFEEQGEHVRGFDTEREAMDEVCGAQRCFCETCKEKSNGKAW